MTSGETTVQDHPTCECGCCGPAEEAAEQAVEAKGASACSCDCGCSGTAGCTCGCADADCTCGCGNAA